MSSPINDVSDTAYWIAHLRALESERRDALFRDPLAALLAGERGRKISEAMPTSRIVGWTVALRTRIIDEYIALAIEAGVDTVLSLGAGLDARPYRMALPAALEWIEADYAHVLAYKESRLAGRVAHCRLERVEIDLADSEARQRLLARVDAASRGILVLTEGLVPYLTNDAVAALADALGAMRHVRFWIVDYFSATALEYRSRRPVNRAMQNAPFKFAPGDWFGFFAAHGWRATTVRYFPEEGRRWGRPMPVPPHVAWLSRLARPFMPRRRREAFRTFAGYALLEPAARAEAGNAEPK